MQVNQWAFSHNEVLYFMFGCRLTELWPGNVWEISQELLKLVAGGGNAPQVCGSGTDCMA